ncbi:hypothetical protein U8V72_20980 [Priestia filamentosa]|uniref:hypothetical protein n=1 Tax=Priestia filamentosa TaxID=1402861 RepID=UPI00397E8931
MSEGLDARQFLIAALGYNYYLHKEIDKLYEKGRWTYYEAFRNSQYYNDKLIKSFTPVREEKMKKVAGILEWCLQHDDLTLINRLIKKGYKDVWQYYKQNKKQLDLEKFVAYIKKKRDGKHELPILELLMYIAVLTYIVADFNKGSEEVNTMYSTEFGYYMFVSLNELMASATNDETFADWMDEEESITEENVIKFIEETLRINVKKKIPPTISSILQYTRVQGIREGFKEPQSEIQQDSPMRIAYQIQNNNSEKDIFKYIEGYEFIFINSELNVEDLLDVEITKDELLIHAYNSLCRQEANQYTNEDVKQYFIASLFIHGLFTQYKKQKEIFIRDTTESWYLDVRNKEKQIKEKERLYEQKEKGFEKQLRSKEDENQNYLKEIEKLKKENERLKNEIDANKEEKEELIELRSFAYNQQKIDVVPSNISIKNIVESLNHKKVIVCGGHPNMQRRLKEQLPELDTLQTDTIGKSFAYLTNYDIVYFYPNYASHSFYRKIKSAIYNSDTQLIYLPDVDNMEQLLLHMYSNIATETVG